MSKSNDDDDDDDVSDAATMDGCGGGSCRDNDDHCYGDGYDDLFLERLLILLLFDQ